MIFTANDYATLRALTFRDDYPGFRPQVVESPNGDGVLDTGKSYSHVSDKYLTPEDDDGAVPTPDDRKLWDAYRRAHATACTYAVYMGLAPSRPYWPSFSHGALRILHYPPGTASAVHTDMSLFTVMCYRNVVNPGLPTESVAMGELGELLGLGPATPHRVDALDVEQESIVYFCMPDHAAVLPGGGTAGEWINERIKRSRYDAK